MAKAEVSDEALRTAALHSQGLNRAAAILEYLERQEIEVEDFLETLEEVAEDE